MNPTPYLSVVIPVYNSEQIFPVLYKLLVEVLEREGHPFEIIAVVDGCMDHSADVVAEHCVRDPRVKMIEFSRNFGNQMAITAGLRASQGEYVVVMDDDLEDPPEVISDLLAKAAEGFEVVYAVRKKREISALKYRVYKLYYFIFSKLSNYDIPQNVGDFCIMHRMVVDVLNSMPENNRYIRGLRSWSGFQQTGIEFDRRTRHSGKSGFSLAKYFKFGFDGLFSFSYKPLLLMTYLGMFLSSFSFLLALTFIILKLANKLPDVQGWASITVIILFLGGIQLLSIGVLGQYVGRIYDEVKKRPGFIIKRSVGVETSNLTTPQ
jgi:dolichol-phosphate mannosyltransferase